MNGFLKFGCGDVRVGLRLRSPRIVCGVITDRFKQPQLFAVFCFRRLAKCWLLLLALVLSGWSAWLALPWASDEVTKIYARLPRMNSAVSTDATQGGGVKSAFLQFIHNPPSPEVVAYCGVFLLVFIILSMCVFSSLKRLETQS